MASWKKVIVSGSAAELSTLTLDTALPVAQGGIGATSLTDKAVLISQDSGTDAVGSVALTSNGQVIIGGSDGPAAATISGTSNEITVTNGANSITLSQPDDVTIGQDLTVTRDITSIVDINDMRDIVKSRNITNSGSISDTHITGSFTGSFTGDGSGISGVAGEFPTTPETGVSHNALKFFVNDGGSKFISGSNLAEYVFSKVSGDATVAAGGALTIAANSVEGSMLAKIGIISGSSNNSNLTTAIVSEGANIVSSSAQVSADISGSLSAAAVVGLGAGIISGSSSNSSLTTAIVGEGAGILSGSAQIADDVSGSLSAAAIVGLGAGVISASAMVDHDSTTNFVANEHINHTSVSITAGDGLTGGGTIASTRTLNVVGGDGITANANDIAITAAQTTIESIYKSDLVIGEDDETQIDFETANEIHFDVDNSELLNLAGTKISGSQASTGSFGVLETHGNVNVTTTGRLGVGTADPDFKLDVAGNAGFNEYIRHNGDNDTHIRFQTNQVDISAGGNIYSYDGAAFNLTGHLSASGNISGSQIEASGDIIAFGSSDRNLKDNIQPIENPLEKMDKIGGYTFVWNNKQSTYKGKDIGVVAQEIQEVLPEIVATRANGYLGVKYEKIVPLLIESIKENTKQIKELKQEVEDIKKNCDCLNK